MSDALTAAIFANPQPGDRLSEHLAYWVIVVDRRDEWVWWLEASAPCTLPQDGKAFCGTVAQFSARFRYRSIPGWTIHALKSSSGIEGWLEAVQPRYVGVIT